MRYKIGDIVRVRQGLVPFTEYGPITFVNKMMKYVWKEFTICDVNASNTGYMLKGCVNESGYRWRWSDEMLEPAVDIKPIDTSSLADILLL